MRTWWGDFELLVDQTLEWRVGPARLRLTRAERELRVMHWVEGDAMHDDLEVANTVEDEAPEEARRWRLAFERSPSRVRLRPAMADRAVIASPEHPFFVPAREEATIYLSSVLWFQVGASDGSDPWVDEPLFRPSDTWFGPSTRTGEIAYASWTAARLQAERVPVRPHRAVAAVRIENRADTILQIERIRLPAPNLALHATPAGQLFTESSTLVREEDGDFAALRTEEKPSLEAGEAGFVNGPREIASRNTRLRSFGLVLGREF